LLLIGANGFLGGHLADLAGAGDARVLRAGHHADDEIACELLEQDSVDACLRATSPDSVVNLAGSASVAESWRDPGAGFAVNAVGALHLLEAVARHAPRAHVLCVSSAQVYGEPSSRETAFDESAPLWPLTPYGAAKAAMEVLVGQYARARGMRIAIARLFNQLGPGQPPTQASAEFAREIALAEARGADRVELVLANPDSARDFTDARDTAAALLAIRGRGLTGSFNVCSGRAVGLREMIALLAAMTPLEVAIAASPEEPGPAGPRSSFGDSSRLREATGWKPLIPLERSLAELLEWWRSRARACT
jgi:GDP-4-dehydro-6-deoxy-D-mannose reductase